jgi:hypothetical protein
MPVVELNAAQANRRERRAHLGRPHAVAARALPLEARAPSSIETQAGNRTLPVEHAVLLDLFGRPPVVFHRTFVDIAGGVGAALWLSHAVALAQESRIDERSTFTLSHHACAEATGMSRREQAQARRSLRVAGLLVECHNGVTLGYRVDFERLATLLLERSAATWSIGPHEGASAQPSPTEHASAA